MGNNVIHNLKIYPGTRTIYERAVETGKNFILQHDIDPQNTTVRTMASPGYSKSTVHKDLTERLPKYNNELYQQVNQRLQQNKAERHIRGGEATKQKFKVKTQSRHL